VPAVNELIRAAETDFVGAPEQSEQDLREGWAELDLDCDAWLAEVDGQLAGYGSLDTTAPLADGVRSLPKLQIPTFAADERAQELLRAHGHEEVRRYYKMEIELDAPPEPPESWPTPPSSSRRRCNRDPERRV
jgi:hypothetical protein